MAKILFISNVAGKKMGSFSISAIEAARHLNLDFYFAANLNALSDKYEEEKKYNIKLFHIDIARNPFSKNNYKAYRQLKRIINDENIDFIHCNTPTGGVLGRLIGKRCKVKKIIYQAHGLHFYHGAPIINWFVYFPIEKFLSRYTDVVVTINEEDYEAAHKFRLKKGGFVRKINGVGIDLKNYKNIRDIKDTLSKKLSISNLDTILISVGELNTNKNNKVVLQAMSKLGNCNIHYLLCGVGNRQGELETLAATLGISKQIHFLGYCENIPELLNASDIFIMPSYREGLSRSIMEAMAVGLPCIVSKIRGNVDLITEGQGGLLVPPDEVDGFAEAIDTLVKDQNLREKMTLYNLQRIEEFSAENIKSKLISLYKETFNIK